MGGTIYQIRTAFAITLLGILILSSAALPVHAFGISPPEIEVDTVLRGVPQTTQIRISRLPSETGDLNFTVKAVGDYAPYLELPAGFILPDGVDGDWYTFTINPKDAAAGTYEIPVNFLLVPDKTAATTATEGAFVSIIVGATAKVRFTVTGDEVVAYEMLTTSFANTESDKSVFATFVIQNKGNVNWRPEKAEITFQSQEDALKTYSASVSSNQFALIAPGQLSQQQIEIKQSLPEGSYTAHIVFYDKGAVVAEQDSGEFLVLAPGSLAQSGELESVTLNGTSFSVGERVLVSGVFQNTGEIPVNGVFMAELYRGDTYIDIIRGDELIVDVDSSTEYSLVFEPKEEGQYRLVSYMKYGGRKSNSFESFFSVGALPIAKVLSSWIGIAILAGVCVLLALVFMLWRRRKQGKEGPKPPSASPPAQSEPPKPPSVQQQPPSPIRHEPSPETVSPPASESSSSERW